MSKEHITRVYNQNKVNDRIATNFAYTLESNITTVVSSQYQFVFELLQNADDSADPEQTTPSPEVEFCILGSSLLVSHNGQHFTEEDVERICSYATHASQVVTAKNRDNNKTGYKGVGFKAVFCISRKVTIISREYCFRFDEDYWQQEQFSQTAMAKYPWPVIPILTSVEELEASLGRQLDRGKVHFLLENVNVVNVQKELTKIFGSLELLLTLRNISQIKLNDNQMILSRNIELNGDNGEYVTLSQQALGQEPIIRRWYKKVVHLTVTPELRVEMAGLDEAQCPKKIKKAEEVNLIFAANVDLQTKQLIPCQVVANLCCYLPTAINTGLPFLVNADFLLNHTRAQVLNNCWNQFLLYKIGEMQFAWLAEIARDGILRPSMLKILANSRIQNVHSELQDAYYAGFRVGLANIPFLPSNQQQLLLVRQAVVDKTNFFHTLGGRIIDPEHMEAGQSKLVAAELQDVLKLRWLREHGLIIYGYGKLFNRLEHYLRANDYNSIIITFLLYFKTLLHERPQFVEEFKKKKILVAGNTKELMSPGECYLPKGKDSELARLYPLNIVQEPIITDKAVLEWLEKIIHVRTITRLSIIRGYIFDLIRARDITYEGTAKNTINLLRFI